MSYRKSVLAIVAALAAVAHGRAAEFKVGDSFPDIRQFNLAGELPADLKGKVLLVDFWASWCAPCKLSFPVLNDLNSRYASRGLVVIGISVDESKPAMQNFLKATPAQFPIAHDAHQKLVQRVDVPAMPTTFIVDAKGTVRFVHSGFHGDKTREQYVREIESLLSATASK